MTNDIYSDDDYCFVCPDNKNKMELLPLNFLNNESLPYKSANQPATCFFCIGRPQRIRHW